LEREKRKRSPESVKPKSNIKRSCTLERDLGVRNFGKEKRPILLTSFGRTLGVLVQSRHEENGLISRPKIYLFKGVDTVVDHRV